jgi:hypothetical protein
MEGDFGALAELASPCQAATILLHAWPHKTLCDQLSRYFGTWVRHTIDGQEHLEP